MKRIIAAVSFAVLAVPAAALAAEASAPYEKPQFDRTLPNVKTPAGAERASAGSNIPAASIWAHDVWAKDPAFIAPAR
jgi:hypothetical protein